MITQAKKIAIHSNILSTYIIIPNPDIEITIIAQALDAPGKPTKLLITNKLTTHFVHSPCTPMAYTLFRDSILGFGIRDYI